MVGERLHRGLSAGSVTCFEGVTFASRNHDEMGVTLELHLDGFDELGDVVPEVGGMRFACVVMLG